MSTGIRSTVTRRIASGNPAHLLYGAIISASVLATASAHSDEFDYVALATAVALGVYWLAHVYVAAHSRQFHSGTRHLVARIALAAGHESGVLKGGLPAIVVYLLGIVVGLPAGAAAEAAVYFSVALLMWLGYLTAHQVGRTGPAALVDAALAGLFGLVLIAAKALLH